MQTLQEIEKEVRSVGFRVYGHVIARTSSSVSISPGQVPVFWIPTKRTTEAVVGADGGQFNNDSLCTWLPSFERTFKKGVECTGLLRPAFEVVLSGQKFAPSTKVNANPVCLFTCKRLDLKPKELISLH